MSKIYNWTHLYLTLKRQAIGSVWSRGEGGVFMDTAREEAGILCPTKGDGGKVGSLRKWGLVEVTVLASLGGQLGPYGERMVSGQTPLPQPFLLCHRALSFVLESARDMWLHVQSTLTWGIALPLGPWLGQPEEGSRREHCLSVLERSPLHMVFTELTGRLPDWEPAKIPAGNLGRFQHPFYGEKLLMD